MKKLLYSLGTLTTITPIFAVIACGNKETKKESSTDDDQNKPSTQSGDKDRSEKPEGGGEEKTGKSDLGKQKSESEVLEASQGVTLKISVSSSEDNLAKIRDHVYVYNDAPDALVTLQDGPIKLQDLDIEEQDLIKNEIGINSDNTEFIFTSQSLDTTTQTTYSYSSDDITSDVETKDVTIHYNYLSFEVYKNATQGVVDKILNLDKTLEKDDVKTKTSQWTFQDDKSKNLFIKYLDSADSFETVWYMTKFMKASTSYSAIFQASLAINTTTTGTSLLSEESIIFFVNKIIINGNMDIEETARGIISRFEGEDTDFVAGTVQLGATVANKQLIKGSTWSTAADAMGGDETVSYILGKISYTLADPTS